MDINSLYSIIDLYLRKENDKKKCNLIVTKVDDDNIKFSFNMDEKDVDVTSFNVSLEKVFENNNFYELIRMYKQNNIIIDEKYTDDIKNSIYYILLNNGRKISFRNFNLTEVNNIRNVLYDIKFQKEEIRIKFEEEEENKENYYFRLQPTGFANFKMLCGVTICFAVIFILSLWIFNVFIR